MQIIYEHNRKQYVYFPWLTEKKLSNPEMPNFDKLAAFDLAKENELLINSNVDLQFLKTQKWKSF